MAKDYMGMLDVIENYYGYKSPQWNEIFKDGISPSKIYETLDTIPNVTTLKNKKGEVLFYKMKHEEVLQGVNIGSNSNSNTQLPVTSPINKTTINAPISTTVNNGKVTLGNGLKSAGKFVMNTVAPAVTAASVGISLGKKIDELLYNMNPDFWDEHGMSSLNPDTWDSITSGDDSLGTTLFNMVFGINSDTKETQAYLDENAYAYLALYLQNKGVFNNGYIKPTQSTEYYNLPSDSQIIQTNVYAYNMNYNGDTSTQYAKSSFPNQTYIVRLVAEKCGYESGYHNFTNNIAYTAKYTGGEPCIRILKHSQKIELGTEIFKGYGDSTLGNITYGLENELISFQFSSLNSKGDSGLQPSSNDGQTAFYFAKCRSADPTKYFRSIWESLYRNGTYFPAIDGLPNQENATLPQLSTDDTVEQTLAKLKEQYPQLWENAVTNQVVQPDGTTKDYTYIPVPMPQVDSQGRPTSTTQTQTKPSINPETSTQDQIQTIIDIISPTPPDNISDAPNTGEGSTPPVVLPSGSANALYSIYNPSQEELNQFGSWLWSNNFVDQLLKMFNNPMEAIIGLHKVYGVPLISGRGNIKVGYLDAGVETNLVANQYVTIDCGFVDIPEYFGNVLDYDPYTKISLYLPFIGIVPLNTADVTRSTLMVKYNIDVLSGACMAEVGVIRDGVGGILYSYSGNCSVQYPLSSGSYMGIVGGVLGVAGSLIGTALTGGAMLPAVAMAGASATHMRTSVSQSGSLSGNSGAMGIKKPYVIISRPQTALADNFNKFDGYPANHYTRLSNCTGFTKVESCHVENISCTDYERQEIEKLLKNGVFV